MKSQIHEDNSLKTKVMSTKQILKTVLAGILAGVLLFMMPFIILKVLVVLFLLKSIFRLMGGGRHRHQWRYAYAQKFNNMSEDDRKAFMEKYGHRCGPHYKGGSENFGTEEKNKTTNF
ncbi:hypothetical protein CNR22_24075 [Sphingobacteriaceae bacterium]|nr:hypothetical protein CNR22_24075 [Sphingobacteriaceae bacterium]